MNDSTPIGYSTVCPFLMVDNIEKQMTFLVSTFNGSIKEELRTADGEIQHGEIRIGNIVIMIGRGSKEYPSQASMNYVYVENVDEVYNRAIQNGATKVFEPIDRFYGIRESGVKDLHGNTWWISQHLKEVSKEDMEHGFDKVKNKTKF